MERYIRNRQAITVEEQALLATKRVFVAGCGGLGGYVIEQLARIGIGSLSVLDRDVFEVSNLNRQLYAREDNLGQSKAAAAQERVRHINSKVSIDAFQVTLDDSNARQLVQSHDLVIDAFDSFAGRILLEQACEENGIPLIHGAIAGALGQFALILPGDRLLEKIYSQSMSESGIEKTQGTLACTAAIVASYQVALALRVLLRKGAISNQLYYLDLASFEIETIPF